MQFRHRRFLIIGSSTFFLKPNLYRYFHRQRKKWLLSKEKIVSN